MPDNTYLDEDLVNNNNKSNKSEKKKFPYEIKRVDPDINKELLDVFSGEKTTFVQVGPHKYIFPSGYEKNAENYYNFEVRPDDTWIITYPRSGTTWTQEMVWLLTNNHDYETAMQIPLVERFPFLEFSMCVHPEIKAQILKENNSSKKSQDIVEEICSPAWKILKDQNGKRFIKTHFPFSLLPPNLLTAGCKVIYVARNPKDVVVSYYHLNRLFKTQGYQGDFKQHVDFFMRNLLTWSPYWCHLQEAWELRHSKNLLFMFYEQMSKDLRQSIKKVSTFLEKDLSEKQLDKLENHLQFENFRNNESVNSGFLADLGITNNVQGFVRKGKTSSWKDDATADLIKKMDKWIEDNLKNTDMRFENF
ncbi:hypothetical protein RN001_013879 [Aquatica leii]|uniref:Sulfotransferase domain-containing protein n=1 Tax=Aquatica leii TaxID=1421715 RepID=A0AAN7PR61_9COLE|nr:hypothetical protein RN001_013879 [Aquatica leii]